MTWIWQKKEWPKFSYDKTAIAQLEQQFLQRSGELQGSTSHIDRADKDNLIVDLLCDEALKTSEIEGELLNHDSLRSSIKGQLGLGKTQIKARPEEKGIAEMMTDLYQHWEIPLTEEGLCFWHGMLLNSRWELSDIGTYRTHTEPMQIVSGHVGRSIVHYEAPPSHQVRSEMKKFLNWYNQEATTLPALLKAGIAHLYFLIIHPFEDGNGRIARAIAIKSLSQSIGHPLLLALSSTINTDKKAYYRSLNLINRSSDITQWLSYFANTIIEAQLHTLKLVEFTILKGKLLSTLTNVANERQIKAMTRIFREGLKGFEGGLSAKNYMTITQASPSTATRDLQELVALGALKKTGDKRGARYYLYLEKR